MTAPKKYAKPVAGKRNLSREDWVQAARDELVRRGISAVKIGRLARILRVTRGSFYWHFASHQELLRALLTLWEDSNTRPFEEALRREGPRPADDELLQILNLFLEEKSYSPVFDAAVRDWARVSKAAEAAVRRIDARRIAILHRVFVDLGFGEPEALVRARVTYFHQVGYYTMDMHEEPEARRSLFPVYVQVLLGRSLKPSGSAADSANPVAAVASRDSAAPSSAGINADTSS